MSEWQANYGANGQGWPFENSKHAAEVLGYDYDDEGYWAFVEGEAADTDLCDKDDDSLNEEKKKE